MKNIKTLMIIITLTLFYIALSSYVVLAANIVIDKKTGPSEPDVFHTTKYANDAACIQAALDSSKSGDTITISAGDYYIKKGLYQKNKNLNIIGKGKVTLHIQTSARESNGIFFNGSMVASPGISFNAYKGSSQVVLIDASQVRQNDLIKIWKNVQWCPIDDPQDYPDQMTGEVYAVKSVNGNVVTLNQPLLRDYSLSETVQVEVYRPIQMHIKNIRIEDTGEKMRHHGISLQYCKDSSVTNCWFNNSGFGAVCLYSCFNVNVSNNEMYNSLYPGSGYGVNVASGTAFVNISHNHIENCRHAITGNSAELKSLNRDVFITDNILIGAKIPGSNVVDAHADTIDFVVTRNKIYPQIAPETPSYYSFADYRIRQDVPYYFAFSDGTQRSIFSNNEVFGGFGGVFKRGAVTDGVHIIENNSFIGLKGEMYEGGNGTDNLLIIRNNTHNNGKYGVNFPFQGSFRTIIISENTFSNLSRQGVYQKFQRNGVNLSISKNTFENLAREGLYIDGNSFNNGVVKIQDNVLINVDTSNSSSGITIKNIQNAIVSGNQIFKKGPLAAFSASPTSGYAPMKVKFTDRSVGSPISWRWSFGDGTSSTAQNPTHMYSKSGKYPVSLTVKSASGSNTVTKSSLIVVDLLKPPVAAFSATPLTGKAPLTVRFTDKSTNNPNSWSWNFGDKSTSKTKNPTHKYTKAGKYTVKLIVKNGKGTNSETKMSYIIVK